MDCAVAVAEAVAVAVALALAAHIQAIQMVQIIQDCKVCCHPSLPDCAFCNTHCRHHAQCIHLAAPDTSLTRS